MSAAPLRRSRARREPQGSSAYSSTISWKGSGGKPRRGKATASGVRTPRRPPTRGSMCCNGISGMAGLDDEVRRGRDQAAQRSLPVDEDLGPGGALVDARGCQGDGAIAGPAGGPAPSDVAHRQRADEEEPGGVGVGPDERQPPQHEQREQEPADRSRHPVTTPRMDGQPVAVLVPCVTTSSGGRRRRPRTTDSTIKPKTTRPASPRALSLTGARPVVPRQPAPVRRLAGAAADDHGCARPIGSSPNDQSPRRALPTRQPASLRPSPMHGFSVPEPRE